MVKFATSLLVAALVAAPAFASIDWDQIDARELAAYEEVFGRELADVEATVFGRDYDELFTRHPDDLGLESREYEDIASRSVASKIRSGFRKAFGFVKSVLFKREEGQDGVFAREYEEIDARDLEDLYERYADELAARAPGFFQHILQDGMRVVKAVAHQGAKKPEVKAEAPAAEAKAEAPASEAKAEAPASEAKAEAPASEAKAETPAAEAEPAPEPAARDFDDLLERDFFDEDLVERDLDLDLDLVQRDFDEDLYGREYVDDLYERDFDLDLVERELFDLEERSFDDLD